MDNNQSLQNQNPIAGKSSSPQPTQTRKILTNIQGGDKGSNKLDLKMASNNIEYEDEDDSDDLKDDIEDVNASYSDYSVAKIQSTQNSSRSGNSSGSGSSAKRSKKKRSMFNSLLQRFQRMMKNKNINKNEQQLKQDQQIKQTKGGKQMQQDEATKFDYDFQDQLKKIRESQKNQNIPGDVQTKQAKKQIFKIDEDDTPDGDAQSDRNDSENPNTVTVEEEYISSEEDNQDSNNTKSQLQSTAQKNKAAEQDQEQDEAEGEDEEDYDEEAEYDEEEEEYGEESDDEEYETLSQCVHRLPFKGQRVNLLNFGNVIEIEKDQPKQVQKKGLFQNWFKKEVNKNEHVRFLTFYENRLLVLKSTPEQVRRYGSHFNNQDLEKIQMPKIWWNAQIRSSRELTALTKIRLLNYKQVFGNQEGGQSQNTPGSNQIKATENNNGPQIVKLQLEWKSQLPYKNFVIQNVEQISPSASQFIQKSIVKTYLIDKESLEDFIYHLQKSLRGQLTKTQMFQSKTQFYSGDGTGRDTYIQGNNGGFCPATMPTKIEELGTFYFMKQRAKYALPTIHSKGVQYINNGGGRDTYISDSAGGLRSMYSPAQFKSTFYNNLRVYDKSNHAASRSLRSHTATKSQQNDIFTKSQQHFNDKFTRESNYIRNYQKNLDLRLSMPKVLQETNSGKVIKNSGFDHKPLIIERQNSGDRIDLNSYQKYNN
ncbi:UNKNOWN [Stylonychia lemnae]|uniref:Uncharacterized protein n=1 Tax=Stylonychia lemnae TaxID=5949 RepID=A0A077ZUJ4_STYLE|nr:UNKNOWN [Stylonychia lemnae]|eukprot:CDW72970.1 UNKNOWN [Stylonychia lemnae]